MAAGSSSSSSRRALVLAVAIGVCAFVLVRNTLQLKRVVTQQYEPLPSFSTKAASSIDPHHKIAGLDCARYGGPVDAQEMVYWRDIPKDAAVQSPLSLIHI